MEFGFTAYREESGTYRGEMEKLQAACPQTRASLTVSDNYDVKQVSGSDGEGEKLTMEGYNPKMVRERTGYRTLNRTRMVTGSGQPLFSKVQSLNIELLSSCVLFFCFFQLTALLSYCCRTTDTDRALRQTAAQGPHVHRHDTRRSPVLRLKAVSRKKF